MATKRMLQLAEQIREHIALMLVRGEISDPRVRGITLNSVKMSPDLQIAKVYFSVLGEKQKRQEAEKGLKQASGYIRRELGKALLVRYTPAVIFHYDDSIVMNYEKTKKVEIILMTMIFHQMKKTLIINK